MDSGSPKYPEVGLARKGGQGPLYKVKVSFSGIFLLIVFSYKSQPLLLNRGVLRSVPMRFSLQYDTKCVLAGQSPVG